MNQAGRLALVTLWALACQDVRERTDAAPQAADLGAIRDAARGDGRPEAADAGDASPALDGAEPQADGAPPDASRLTDGQVPPDAARPAPDSAPDTGPPPDATSPPDAALPPLDVECDQPWTDPVAGRPPRCAGRWVIDLAAAVAPRTVAIARSSRGRVAVGWNEQRFADSGAYILQVLDESDGQMLRSYQLDPAAEFGESVGVASALAVLRETFHLLTWLQSDFGSEIHYRQLRADDLLTEPEVVSALVGRSGAVDLVVDRDGAVHAGWHDKASGVFAVRSRASDGAWSAAFTIDTDLSMDTPGPGAMALALGDAGVVHAAYQLTQSRGRAAPRHRARVGPEWTLRRTLDNQANDRLSGISLDLAVWGEQRAAAYLDWVGGTGELRLARWTSGDAPVEVSVLMDGLALPEAPGTFPLALAVDDFGLLHLIVLAPGRAGSSTLEYRRQALVGGEPRWLLDVIDDDVPADPGAGMRVDLFVDPQRRPHIVYFDPSSGQVRYATALPREP